MAAVLIGVALVPAPATRALSFSESLSDAVSQGYFAVGPEWQREAPELERRMSSAPSPQAAQWAAAALVQLAGGKHSGLLTAGDVAAAGSPSAENASDAVPSVRQEGCVAVLRLPAFVASTEQQVTQYAFASVTAIQGAEQSRPCGWVVDLRGNSGGTTKAMLAAVAPLLRDGVVLSVVDRVGVVQQVRVVANTVRLTDAATHHGWSSGLFGSVKVPVGRLAVLTDAHTASAAEAVALALRSVPDARSFGAPTYGLTSYNEAFTLPNGWAVRLTTGVYADTAGHTYVNVPLRPDATTPAPMETALRWLAQTPLS